MVRKERSRKVFSPWSNLLVRRNKAKYAQGLSQLKTDRNSFKTSLLHLAALYNNVDLMRNLLNLKCDVNDRDSAGKTPLLIAVIYSKCEAMKLLLDNNADVLAEDEEGQTPMQLLLGKVKYVCVPVVRTFLEKFKTSGLSIEEMAKILMKAACPLDVVVLTNNPQVIQIVLESRKIIGIRESDLTMNVVLNTNDNVESIRVLLQYGFEKEFRRYRFFEYFKWLMSDYSKNVTIAESHVKHLVSWDIIGERELHYFNDIFVDGSEEAIRMLVRQNIHEYVVKKFGKNLLVILFHRLNLNAIEIIKDAHFCVNVPYKGRRTALHYAASLDSVRNVKFLLDLGADPNARDRGGFTPLFYTCDVDCIKILWQAGADIQEMVDIRGENFVLLDKLPAIAYLAIIEGRGVMIKSEIRDQIESRRIYSQCYEKCKGQIDWLKNRVLFGNFTLFDALDGNRVGELTRYVKRESIVEQIFTEIKENFTIVYYYYSILEENFNRALRLSEFRRKVASMISESMGVVNVDHLVVEKIVNFVNYKDLYKEMNEALKDI